MVIQDHIWAMELCADKRVIVPLGNLKYKLCDDKRVIIPLGNLKYNKVSPFVFENNSPHGRCISNRPPSTCIHLARK
jgi:hypothetical protein